MLFSMVPAGVLAADKESSEPAISLENPFNDVKEGSWYYDSVQYVRVNGIFNGTTADTFDPQGTMTRAMFVTVLGRMAGVVVDDYKGESAFTDVSADAYYAPYVAWAAKHGITTGTSENTFSPSELITRQQMATFFVRYFDAFGVEVVVEEEITTTPADIDSAAPYAREAILKLWKTGLLNGDGENFNPSGYASRAQTATLCARADESVEVWYREPGVESERVRIDPATGEPYDKEDELVICSVRFYDGDEPIDTLYAILGQPLGRLPDVEKSSKADAILLDYYLDPEFTEPFYAEEPVVNNMKVYAKYHEMESAEELNFTTFTQIDLKEDPVFEIIRVSGSVAPSAAATVNHVDGTEVIEPTVTEGADGVYTVTADYSEGSSYELTLAEGWVFKDKPETIRTASFSLDKEEVANLAMNDDIVYIPDSDAISYTVNGKTHDVLSSSVALTDADGNNYTGTISGYTAPAGLEAGDIICIYVGVHPDERAALSIDDDPDNDAALLDPAVYVKVSAVDNGTVSFVAMGEDDQLGLYDVPDNFPFYIEQSAFEALTDSGTVDIELLDLSMYETAMGKTAGTLAGAKEKMSKGDFVTFYYELDSETPALYYGRVTEVNGNILSYTRCTEEEILTSMDVYANINLAGSMLITEAEKQELETQLLQQVSESEFANEAAGMLGKLVVETDNFRNNPGVQELMLMGLEEDELSTMALDPENIKIGLELITSGNKLHFNGGTQLALTVDVEFEIEAEDGSINVDLTADFVEEVALAPKVSGDLTYKKILGIPFPNGVEVSASVDIKNFTAFSFQADIYTSAAESESLLESFKSAEFDKMGLPEGLVSGIDTIKEAIDKAEELQAEIDRAAAAPETLKQYKDDVTRLWKAISESDGGISKAEWDSFCSLTNMTSVTSELIGIMDDAEAEGVTDDYKDTLEALMQRYSDTLSRDTDWVKLLEKELVTAEVCILGLCIGVEATFVIRADINISIGSSLEYEVGKRYSFWFRIGLYAPTAGSETMDLIDEHFAFQFYVMGKLGIKMGVSAQLYVALGTKSLASVGIRAEMGPYLKLWGFFVYEFSKYRPANTQNWDYKERMAGALYLEFGLYFMLSFEAEALGMFSYSHEFLNEEIPLLTCGDRRYHYRMDYVPYPDEVVIVRDYNADSTDGVTMELPEYFRGVAFVDLVTGILGTEIMDLSKFHFSVSNPNFSIDDQGIINVDVPRNVRYMECDLTITYLHGKLAFSTYDMSVTVPLVWTNLATSELKEFHTASVRVGDGSTGRFTVWSDRYLKGEVFSLPTADEIIKLIGANPLMYSVGNGYGSQQTTDLTIIEDNIYDFDINYKEYSITVGGVQNADGSTTTQTFTAKYGETFDFSALKSTGTENSASGIYTKFTEVTATVDGKEINLREPVDATIAKAINAGKLVATANYVDDSVKAVFTFNGITHDDVVVTLRKGEAPSTAAVVKAVEDTGTNASIKEITPAVSLPIETATTYTVDCVTLSGQRADIVFNYERASTDQETVTGELESMDKLVGSLIVNLHSPERIGYTFDGWFNAKKDVEDAARAETLTVPEDGINLYAHWTPVTYTVKFQSNLVDGNDFEDITVYYDQPYGELPTPVGDSNYGFAGWFTDPYEGVEVDAKTLVTNASLSNGADAETHTLYARWKTLIEIPDTAIKFGAEESKVYDGTPLAAKYSYGGGSGVNYIVYDDGKKDTKVYQTLPYPNPTAEDSTYTYKYKRDDSGVDFEPDLPYNAGYYGVTVQRARDNDFKSFDHYYTYDRTASGAQISGTGIVRIHKATGSFNVAPSIKQRVGSGVVANPISSSSYTGDGQVQFTVTDGSKPGDNAEWTSGVIGGLSNGNYVLWARLAPGMNYTGSEPIKGESFSVSELPTLKWNLWIQTSTQNKSGTDANIYAIIDGVSTYLYDGKSGDGNTHENGDFDKHPVSVGNLPDSSGHIVMGLSFDASGSSDGWLIDHMDLDAVEGSKIIKSATVSGGGWFDNNAETRYYTFSGYSRGLNAESYLHMSNGKIWIDSSFTDNLSKKYDDPNYNPYSRPNSPKLYASFCGSTGYKNGHLDGIFDAYIRTTDLYTVEIDYTGLYKAMWEYRIETLTLSYGINFNNDNFNNIYDASNVNKTTTITLPENYTP